MTMPLDHPTYQGLHPSDRVALHFHAALTATDEEARRSTLDRLDAWIDALGPRFDGEQIRPLLGACKGTMLEPMSLGDDAIELAVRFVQIVFSEQVRGASARIVSEETLGISGGLCIREDLRTQYAERRGGGASNPGEGADWYFAPAGLRGREGLQGKLARPPRVSVDSSDEHGFLLAISGLDIGNLGWAGATHSLSHAGFGPSGLQVLATDLERHSTLGTAGLGLGSLLTRLPRERPRSGDATFQWAPASAEAIVRFSALLAAGHTLRLDPGERYPKRAIASVALRLPDDQPSELDVRLIRTAPVLTTGLWAELGDAVPSPPWSGVFDQLDAYAS
jgi:hypothetical protein